MESILGFQNLVEGHNLLPKIGGEFFPFVMKLVNCFGAGPVFVKLSNYQLISWIKYCDVFRSDIERDRRW